MPRMTQDIEPIEFLRGQLEPEVEQEVRSALVAYQLIAGQVAGFTALLERKKQAVCDALEASGELGCIVDNISVGWVFPERSTLNKKKLLAQGVTMAQIEVATVTEPTKPYFRIYLPKDK